MRDLEENSDYLSLGFIDAGDIVHLKSRIGLAFLLKCVVTKVDSGNVIATVRSAYSYDGSSLIEAGAGAEYIGTEIEFSRRYVHKIISKSRLMKESKHLGGGLVSIALLGFMAWCLAYIGSCMHITGGHCEPGPIARGAEHCE